MNLARIIGTVVATQKEPTLNGLRALVGGADDQDYLRRQGGWAALTRLQCVVANCRGPGGSSWEWME